MYIFITFFLLIQEKKLYIDPRNNNMKKMFTYMLFNKKKIKNLIYNLSESSVNQVENTIQTLG